MNTFTRAALTVLVGLVIWFLPHTEAIKPEGWHLLAIFTATIVGFILRPWPTGIMALFGIVVAVATNSITMVQALGGYAEANVWLIVAAVFFSRGIINSGLGKRIAYTLIRSFGTSSLKLAYALACTDLIISPATPSNTARGGGIIFPIVQNISLAFDSEPNGSTARRIGAYLMTTAHTINT
ncbi:MAG: SLC13 family permease, partial [Veillonella sp.]|nr:SLC13 family permease [Veillonella sp.]